VGLVRVGWRRYGWVGIGRADQSEEAGETTAAARRDRRCRRRARRPVTAAARGCGVHAASTRAAVGPVMRGLGTWGSPRTRHRHAYRPSRPWNRQLEGANPLPRPPRAPPPRDRLRRSRRGRYFSGVASARRCGPKLPRRTDHPSSQRCVVAALGPRLVHARGRPTPHAAAGMLSPPPPPPAPAEPVPRSGADWSPCFPPDFPRARARASFGGSFGAK